MSREEVVFINNDLLKDEFDDKEDKRLDELLPEKLIDKMLVKTGKLNEQLALTDNKTITRFGINQNSDYDPNQKIPKLVKRSQLNISLDKEFNSVSRAGKLITDYDAYRKKKWDFFLKCLQENKVIETEKPCFVANSGLIAGLMASIEDEAKHFRVYAQIFNGVIYLFANKSFFTGPDKHSFCGLKFLYLMSDRKLSDMNGFEKHFTVNTVALREHEILTLNEVHVTDEYDTPVDLKSKKIVKTQSDRNCFEQKKLLHVWANCSVSGIQTIYYGYRDSRNILKYVKEYSRNDLPLTCSGQWSDVKCVDFLDRLLNFIKHCVTQEFVVYEFCYGKRDEFVCCKRYNAITRLNSFLPKWYVNSEELAHV